MSSRLFELLHRGERPTILVLGDVMLDGYVHGDVDRISPEAPIPILRVSHFEERLGGAGSVTTMLAALDVDVRPVAIVGDDVPGRRVRELLAEMNVSGESVLTVADRPTTFKQRLLGRTHSRHPHQMVRVDHEHTSLLDLDVRGKLVNEVGRLIDGADAVLVSDYNKGVCTESTVGRVVAMARQAGVPVLADPVPGVDYHRYARCGCITPNRTETSQALGRPIRSVEDGLRGARQLLEMLQLDAAIVTLDSDGIALADRAGRNRHFPICPIEVCDITGAGDMVLSVLGLALALGADWPDAITLANTAAGLEVQRLGCAPVSRMELLAELTKQREHVRSDAGTPGKLSTPPCAADKILAVNDLLATLASHRQAGREIVMTNGCFDLLHPGHIASLEAARHEGDVLVVGLNSDQSVEKLKGPARPIIDQAGRAMMLASLACVDYVVLFDDPSVYGLIERIVPDVLVKAAQYTTDDQVVGHEIIEASGGRIARVAMQGGYSTSSIIERIRRLDDDERSRHAA